MNASPNPNSIYIPQAPVPDSERTPAKDVQGHVRTPNGYKRAKNGDTVKQVTLMLTEEQARRLEVLAAQEGLKKSAYIILALNLDKE